MAIKKAEWFLILFNLIYIIGFTIYYISIRNFEFLWYIFIMIFFFVVIFAVQKKVNFSYTILWLLTIWGLLHMIGGGVIVNGEVMYKFQMIPIWVTEDFYILKYDQFVHGYLYFVMVFVIWHLLKSNLDDNVNNWILYPVIVLASIGLGALNEIAEFTAVLAFAETGVGGYYNTAWDLVFNTLGALLAAVIIGIRRKREIH